MQTLNRAGASWFSLLVIFLFLAGFSSAWGQNAPATATPATVIDVSGEVQVRVVGATEAIAVMMGRPLAEGDTLTCGAASRAVVEMGPGHRAAVEANTTVTLAQLRYQGPAESTVLDLAVGRILSNVKKLRTKDSEYSIRTPTAAAAVRGTVYEVAYDTATRRTTVRVLKGLIELDARIGTMLQATLHDREKSGVDAQGGVAPVEPLPRSEVRELGQASRQTSQAKGAGGKSQQLQSLQSSIDSRLDAIQSRSSDDFHATQSQQLNNGDDDD